MRLVLILLAVSLTLPAVPAPAPSVEDLYVHVGHDVAHGLVAHPNGEPLVLVVILHGYLQTSEAYRERLVDIAARGAVGVAMDYRGGGFPLRAGADDTIAATNLLLEQNPTIRHVFLYSVSMGTAVAPLVLAEMPSTFDAWVQNEGIANLHETWGQHAALAPADDFIAQALADIQAECGGTPVDSPACYTARSATLRAGEYGLEEAHVVHGVNDGIVPYNQMRELVAALRAEGIRTDAHTVLRGSGDEGVTMTGHAGVQVDRAAGHGNETDDEHALNVVSFRLLYALIEGELAPAADREHVVDRDLSATA